jgi:hypothetical protein
MGFVTEEEIVYRAVRKGLLNMTHFSLIPSILHAYLHPHVAFTGKTSGRIVGNFKQIYAI